jgi:hypothetical protein
VPFGGGTGARGASRRTLHVRAAIAAVRGAASATRGAGVGGVLHGGEGHGGLLLAWISNRIDNAEDLRARRLYRRSMALRPTTAPYAGEK